MKRKYNPREIEKKWQKFWEDEKTFIVSEDTERKNFISSKCFHILPAGFIWGM